MRSLFLSLIFALSVSGNAPLCLAADIAPVEQNVSQLETIMPVAVANKQAEPQTQQVREEREVPRQKCTYGHAESVDL
jgi:hypothetical protein